MKIYNNYLILDKPIKLYDITNLAKATWIPGYWKEYKSLINLDKEQAIKNVRKLLDCFMKENVELSWAKYYIALKIRQTFFLSYPSLIKYSKAFKSPINAIINPNFITGFQIVPKSNITYFRNNDTLYCNEITNIKLDEKANKEFFHPADIEPINKMLKILNSPSFNESKIIRAIKNRLDIWEECKEKLIDRRVIFSPKPYHKYTFCHSKKFFRTELMSYSTMYLSKIGGLLNEI